MSADDRYEAQNDATRGDVPSGDAGDNDYASFTTKNSKGPIPVQKDEAPIDDPIDPATADSDETLGKLVLNGYAVVLGVLLLTSISSG